MGFFKWIMNGLGFEDKEKNNKTDDKYSNFNLHERKPGETTTLESAPSDLQSTPSSNFNFGMPQESNIIVVNPTSQKGIQQCVDYLRQGQSVAVNLSNIGEKDCERILDFLSGAIYGLNGSIHRLDEDYFILTPEGHKILKPNEKL